MNPPVGLTMIVRDAAATLARALTSAAPHVQHLLVVDTGSVDDTVAIARSHGAQVLHFPWIDDFAAARNHALEQSPARYRLVLDADEWIESAPHWSAVWPEHAAGWAQVHNLLDDHAATSTRTLRLLGPGVTYQGRVHEQPVGYRSTFESQLVIGHDGYTSASNATKRGRNVTLLREEIQTTPDPTGYLHYQLGKALAVDDDHAGAVAAFRIADRLVSPEQDWRHDLVVRNLFSLKQSRAHADALDYLEREQPNWQHSPDFHFAAGDVLLELALAAPQAAGELIPLVEASWLCCLELGEHPELVGAVAGRGSFLAAQNLAALYGGLGDQARQRHFQELAARRP